MESLPDFAIFSMDLEGTIVTLNPGGELILGYSESDLLGEKGATIFPEQDKANRQPEQEMETARWEGRAPDERWYVKKDGALF